MRVHLLQLVIAVWNLGWWEVAAWAPTPTLPSPIGSQTSTDGSFRIRQRSPTTATIRSCCSTSAKTAFSLTGRRHGSKASSTCLNAIAESSSLWMKPLSLVVIHILGGFVGVPAVMDAVMGPKGIDPLDKGPRGGWYSRINLPSWTPPTGIFSPVWTFLFATMGFSLHLVLQHPNVTPSRRKTLLLMWGAHYIPNTLWATIFFGLKRFRMGFFLNCYLIVSLVLWMILVGHFQPAAGLLLVPYLGWLVFATFLNLSIDRLNPTVGGYNEARFQSDLLKLRKQAADYADGK